MGLVKFVGFQSISAKLLKRCDESNVTGVYPFAPRMSLEEHFFFGFGGPLSHNCMKSCERVGEFS
ncbi:hypothetical protein SAMN05216459_102109 [Ensifer sp. OV372]|jgi:hypothetical protein|nr:hypothetical protein DEU52_102858 [Ensifer adhaerens]SDL34079.1 hypothetical protein SAMN05216328_101781 [Ensifer sp. YR511]SFF85536.1 hypothetical protein SAMN05216459_102109 [Ensifer sp. OV372]